MSSGKGRPKGIRPFRQAQGPEHIEGLKTEGGKANELKSC